MDCGFTRAGSKFYKGIEMPINAKTFIIKSGQECYLSGLKTENTITIADVYIFELDKRISVDFEKIEKYILN